MVPGEEGDNILEVELSTKLKTEGWCCGPRREGVNILEVELSTKLKTEGWCCGPRRGRSQHFRSGVEYEVED